MDSGPEATNAWTALRGIALVVRRIFRYLWRVDPALLAVQCTLMLLTAAVPAGIVYMTK